MIAIVPIEVDATTLANGLQGKAAPFVVLSAVAGLLALWRLREQRFARARIGAVVAVAAVVVGWGVAQYPDVLVDHATIREVAGARSTLIGLLVVFGLATVTAVPSLVWLFVLVNRRDWGSQERAKSELDGRSSRTDQ